MELMLCSSIYSINITHLDNIQTEAFAEQLCLIIKSSKWRNLCVIITRVNVLKHWAETAVTQLWLSTQQQTQEQMIPRIRESNNDLFITWLSICASMCGWKHTRSKDNPEHTPFETKNPPVSKCISQEQHVCFSSEDIRNWWKQMERLVNKVAWECYLHRQELLLGNLVVHYVWHIQYINMKTGQQKL